LTIHNPYGNLLRIQAFERVRLKVSLTKNDPDMSEAIKSQLKAKIKKQAGK
jgi:hypothetical protein